MRHRLGRACPWQLTVTLGPTALVSKTCTWKHSGPQGRQGWGVGGAVGGGGGPNTHKSSFSYV